MYLRFNQGWLKLRCAMLFCVLAVFLLHFQPAYSQLSRPSQSFKRGDALRLTVWQPWRIGDGKNSTIDLNGDYPIDSRGTVFFPLIGEVKVVGYTSLTLAEALKEQFSPYLQDPIIIVEPLIRVTLLGSFRRPGTYLVDPKASFWQLVDLAGGPTDNSNLSKMWVERGGKKVKKNILSAYEKAYSLEEMGIYSGDQIYAPEKKTFRVRDALEIVRFAVSLLNLYFIIERFD